MNIGGNRFTMFFKDDPLPGNLIRLTYEVHGDAVRVQAVFVR